MLQLSPESRAKASRTSSSGPLAYCQRTKPGNGLVPSAKGSTSPLGLLLLAEPPSRECSGLTSKILLGSTVLFCTKLNA